MYGLIGKKLEHSFSPEIHQRLGNSKYQLYETNDIENFIKSHKMNGFNVTIPYKTEIIPFLDELDEIAESTQSVNTVVVENGKLVGYNTDYYGLASLVSYNNISFEDKNVVLLGNGSVSNTVVVLLKKSNVKSITRLCRNIKSDIDKAFSDYENHNDCDIIINTTPVGMYPNNDDSTLIDLSKFSKLEVVIDLVYNPLRSKLLVEAEILGIKAVNGLYMLVMQAVKAHELFFKSQIPLNLSTKIYKKIYKKHLNVVFVGLPLSGKSKYTKILSQKLQKLGYDIDNIIEKENNKSISEIFLESGEKYFRDYESKVVNDLYKLNNIIISTGGGLIENTKSMNLLKQNGLIVFLNKNPEAIAQKEIYGRPLLKNGSDIIELAKRRIPMYYNHADIVIDICSTTETHALEIEEKIDEYLGC